MDVVASFYPPLSERHPIPSLYLPTCFLLALVPFLCPSRRIGVLVTFPILLLLCIRAPSYTFGSPSADYYNSGPFLAMVLWYLDFAVLTPVEGPGAPVFNGAGWKDVGSPLQKLGWAFRLMIPSHRGIGWNWQVKGVSPDSRVNLSKWAYVRSHLQHVALA
jgi:hypothetical protein